MQAGPSGAEGRAGLPCDAPIVTLMHYRVSRRIFLTELGRASFAIAILGTGIAACATSSGDDETTTTGSTEAPTSSTTDTTEASTTSTTRGSVVNPVVRVGLGGVSAYLVVRGGEAAIIDTGNPGDQGDIEQALAEVGLGWGDVGNVVLTHRHPDHVGSLGPVLDGAAEADAFAGEGDIPRISSPRPLAPVFDGDTVFGLEVIETPGHTAGSISLLDTAAGALICGDAMNGAGSGVSGDGNGVTGANPRFTDDIDQADASIRKLATYTFESVYFGHGRPLEGGAGDKVAELAASL